MFFSQSNRIKLIYICLLFAALATFFFCNKDYNPFKDLTNAKVHVISWSFADRDSVALYETGTFKVVVALRENVDSFSFIAPKNRFWTDTTVCRASADKILEGGPYSFTVSFFDTGRDTVTLTTYRSNFEMLSQDFSVRVYNPLHQENVRGFFGDTIVFSTPRVPDKENVLYHWELGDNWRGSSASNRLSTSFSLFYPTLGAGSLWISDIDNNNKSPSLAFSYSFNDTSKPIIQCVNDGVQGNTIVSGDTVFAFKALISDAGNAEVESCSVNQTAFDFENRGARIYTKLFSNLPELTKNNTPLTVAVYAFDNQQFRNVSCDTFLVAYNPGGIKSSHFSVAVDFPSSDMVATSKRSSMIYGTARSDIGDTMKLSVQVNGKSNPLTETIVGGGQWSWFVSLDTIINTVTVSAHGVDDRLLASAQRVIIFNPNAIDTIKPMIWEVSAGNVLLGNQFYTEESICTLKIVAFDDGSGIAKVVINQDTLPVDTTSYIWYWNSGRLFHRSQGNPVHIRVVDNKNNVQERTIVIYKNSIPSIVGDIGLPAQCCVDSAYNFRLFWQDADNDPVCLNVTKRPVDMEVSQNGLISWKPVRADTGKDTLIIVLEDPYTTNPVQWIFTCKVCSRSIASIAFTTREQDFPRVLQAGFDRLDVHLSVDSSGGSFKPRYGARFIDNGNSLLDNDTSGALTWVPSLTDTGYRKLMVTAGDGDVGVDTLLPAFWVVPKNQYACSLSAAFSGSVTPNGKLDLFSHPAPETLFFTIHDQDNPLTESYTVTVSLHAVSSVEMLNGNEFFVAIKPDSSRIADTLGISVLDRTGTRDSLQFIVQSALSNVNTPPVLIGDPGFPVYVCYDSAYQYAISSYDPDNDIVNVRTIHAPAGMTVSIRGLVQWTPSNQELGDDSLAIRLFDRQDSSKIYEWPLSVIDCANMPPAVRFQTRVDDFPKLLQTDVDSISLQLGIVAGTGIRPFTFNARMDNGANVLSDTIGKLFWRPTNSDTGVRTMTISVKDQYNTSDSLSPQFTVVPRNQHSCHLTYTYSGTTLSSGALELFSLAQPESALFVIHDADNPLTEQYTVKITQHTVTTELNLPGPSRTFFVKIDVHVDTPAFMDTVIVSVNDITGTSDTVNLIIRYPIHSPAAIPQLALSLNSSTGVTVQIMGNQVSKWSDASNPFLSLSQIELKHQPTLVQYMVNGKPALQFEHIVDLIDQGLYHASFGQWADTPFTVFIVFSADSLPANSRQTLVSTNTTDGFGVGIACDGKIGIFNDSYANICVSNEWASANLAVTPRTWYVVSYESNLGITVGGNIRVQAWLNGIAASQPMEIKTQSGPGLIVGTGATDYDGSFAGYIAAIAMYHRALSDDERSLVEKYFGNQYGITIPQSPAK